MELEDQTTTDFILDSNQIYIEVETRRSCILTQCFI